MRGDEFLRIGTLEEYRGYKGTIEYSVADKCHYGKVIDVDDLVNYEADNVIDLVQEFHNSVDEYIDFLQTVEK